MKIILHCDIEDAAHVAALVQKVTPQFDRHPKRVGWGWVFRCAETDKSYFIRQLKDGFSATPV